MLVKILRKIHVGELEGKPIFYELDEIKNVNQDFIDNWKDRPIPVFEILETVSDDIIDPVLTKKTKGK